MKRSLKNIDPMEDDLTCTLCRDLFENPKDLDCPHVFCRDCLQRWMQATATSGGDSIICPECRQKTFIPNGRLDSLRSNVRLKSLASKYKQRRAMRSICEEHGESKTFFCVTCGAIVCHICLKFRHEIHKHKVKKLTDVGTQLKMDLMVTLENARKDIEHQKKIGHETSKLAVQKVQNAAGQSLLQIKKHVQEVTMYVQRRGEELQHSVAQIEQEYMHEINLQNKRLQQEDVHLQSAIKTINKTTEGMTDYDYVTRHVDLMKSAEKLRLSVYQIPEVNVEDFHFHPGIPASLGALPTKICSATLVEEFGEGIFKKAQGIACNTSGMLVVADTDSDRVCVYQRKCESGKFEFCFWLCSTDQSGIVHRPFDVTILPDGTIYVTSECKVKIFSSSGQYNRSFVTLTPGPSRLTSTKANQILVSDNRKRLLTIHKPSGEMLKKFPLCNTAINLATNGQLVAFTNQTHGNVCVIDINSGQQRLNFAVGEHEATTGVCFLDSSHSLLVSIGKLGITGCDRIEQYCYLSGRLIARVLTGLFAPMCLTLVSDNELAVADVGSVQIYRLDFMN